jgi:hypothetical protein
MKKIKITQNQPKLQVIEQQSLLEKIIPQSIWQIPSYGFSFVTAVPKYLYNSIPSVSTAKSLVYTKAQSALDTTLTIYKNLPTIWDAKNAVYTKTQDVLDATKIVYNNLPTIGSTKDLLYAKAQSVFDAINNGYKNLSTVMGLKNVIGFLPKIPFFADKTAITSQEELTKQTNLKPDVIGESEPQKTGFKIIKYYELTDQEKTQFNFTPNLLQEIEGSEQNNGTMVIVGDNITNEINIS